MGYSFNINIIVNYIISNYQHKANRMINNIVLLKLLLTTILAYQTDACHRTRSAARGWKQTNTKHCRRGRNHFRAGTRSKGRTRGRMSKTENMEPHMSTRSTHEEPWTFTQADIRTGGTPTFDSVLQAGSKTLTGSWTQKNGDLSLGNGPIVFTAGSKIRGSLAKSILRDAELIDIDFKSVNFSNTDLTGSSFARSDLSGARFSGAKVTNVDFREAQGLTDRQKAHLKKRGALV